MGFKLINLEVTPEHFDRSIKGSLKEAIKELIWNACDADAKHIDICFEYSTFGEISTVSDIYVKDDGHGIDFDCVADYFGKYGRSQKTYSDTSPGGRVYHGKLGQGRYKSLTVGNLVEWETTYVSRDGSLKTYEIKLNSGARMDITVSVEPMMAEGDKTGTIVHIYGIPEDKDSAITRISEPGEMIPELLETFAPYLMAYSDVSIKYNNTSVEPSTQIKKQSEKTICYEADGKNPITAKVIAITWKSAQFSKIYICGSSGVVYAEQEYTPFKKLSTSVYLLGDHFEQMHRDNTLVMGLADPAYAYFYEEAKKFAKEFTREQADNDAAEEISRIKEEGVYPFDGEPTDEIAKAERNVFDVFAVEINKSVPQLKTAHTQTKKLTYRLMKEAINTNPSSIKTILTEVFNLTQEQQDSLAELLTRTHLPQIIDMAKTIGDRLDFIYFLEQIIYNDDLGKKVKERSQFHKILMKELWVFGEKYMLGTSDQSLKNVLIEYIRCLGREELIPTISPEDVKDLTRIPDICLFQQICPGYEQYENLVIELKRPTLKLTKTEVDQIQDYAIKVSKHPLFDKEKTKWHFILLGQDIDDYVAELLENSTQGVGNFYNTKDGSVAVSVLKWSTIIQDNKFKYEFLRQKLNYELSSDPNFAKDYLLTKHAELFSEKMLD